MVDRDTTERQANDKQTISISIPKSIVDRIKALAPKELRDISSMCAVLFAKALPEFEKEHVSR